MLKGKKTRIEKQIQLISTFSQNALDPSGKEASISIDYVQSVLEYQNRELEKLDMELIKLNKEITQVDDQITYLSANLHKKAAPGTNPIDEYVNKNNVSISIDVRTISEDMKLSFSYIVLNATWTSAYDIRVTSSSDEDVLSLSYFGEVTQTSGEDWMDCELNLSTSNPAISADPPEMKRKVAEFQPTYIPAPNRRLSASRMYEEERSFVRNASFSALDDIGGFPGQQDYMQTMVMQSATQQQDFRKATVEGTGDAGSTVFVINRKVQIESDSKPHKVMIMAKKFRPQLIHYTVPNASPHVYIQAKAKNTSGYPLLKSNKVNIYLDGNFVSKSSMKQANSGETFQFFIGVDPAVKVEYLPTKFEESKKGWTSSTDVKKVFHKTVLHNTKSTDVRVILADSLPMSGNEKIAVDLLEPAPSSLLADSSKASFDSATEAVTNLTDNDNASDSGSVNGSERHWPQDFVAKNKTNNNIIWFKSLKAGEKVDIPFSYRLSWPSGSQIHVNEVSCDVYLPADYHCQ